MQQDGGWAAGVIAKNIKTRLPMCFKHLKQTARHLRNLLEHLGEVGNRYKKTKQVFKNKSINSRKKDKYLYMKGNITIEHFLAYQ